MAVRKKIALFGECMIELRANGGDTMVRGVGGDTLNTAIYLARSGCANPFQICYATALGRDAYSDDMLTRWTQEGIDTSLVSRLDGRLPGLYMIEVDDHGERRFTYWRKDSAATAYFDMGMSPLEAAAGELDGLYFSGISLAILSPAAREKLFAIAATVTRHGGRVIFDNNYRPHLWSDVSVAQRCFERAFALADIALVTLDDELLRTPELSAEQAITRCIASGAREVVIKRGASPTLVHANGVTTAIPTVEVARVVDTTAAGDSFAGAYLATRFAGASAVQSALAGNAVAALVIQHQGAIIPKTVWDQKVSSTFFDFSQEVRI
jgi:2-dehydro-3-deoxygluconokinase